MRFNNTGNSILFNCYGESSTTGDLVKFYKYSGGESGYVDVTTSSTEVSLHATERMDGSNLVVENVQLKYNVKVSTSEWDSIVDVTNITNYGLMFFKTSRTEFEAGATPVQDAINNGKTPLVLSKNGGANPTETGDGFYAFEATINVTNSANYIKSFIAAPFIEVNGTVFFLDEVQSSVKGLAEEYYVMGNSGISDEALAILGGF